MTVLDEQVLQPLLFMPDNPIVLQAFWQCGGDQVQLGTGPALASAAVRCWLPSQLAH
jgi:hypothetical protein